MLMRAARTLVVASLPVKHGLLQRAEAVGAKHRALQLLQTRLDGERAANKLEFELLQQLWLDKEVSSASQAHNAARMEELRKRADAEKKAGPQRQGPVTAEELRETNQTRMVELIGQVYTPLKCANFMAGTPEQAQSPPTAAELADAAQRYVEIARVWAPLIAAQGGAHERVVARLAAFFWVGWAWGLTGCSAAMWDAGVPQELGGLDEWRRGWQLYDYRLVIDVASASHSKRSASLNCDN